MEHMHCFRSLHLDHVVTRPDRHPFILSLTLFLIIILSLRLTPGKAQDITPHEYSPGVDPHPYDYFHPSRSGTFKVIVTPTDVWDQVTPASVAGIERAGFVPVLPAQQEPDPYSAQILGDLAQRHLLEVLLVGDTPSIPSTLVNWFRVHGAASVLTMDEQDLFSRSVGLAEQEVADPRCVVFTTFNLLAAQLAALGGGPAFALRNETSLPLAYQQYLERHTQSIQQIYLVDVGQNISQSQSEYETYGNLTVPVSIEDAIKASGIPVERITGAYEEDVSVALARTLESIYAQAVKEGTYEHLPQGWIPSSSLKSEWTNLGSLIPFAIAKQWFIMEYWADIHLKGREDSVNGFGDKYVQDFFLGLACLRHTGADEAKGIKGEGVAEKTDGAASCPSVAASQSGRREQVICTFYKWLASYLFRTGIRDFILCESNGPYGENAAPIYNFEQVPGMILCAQMNDLFYRGWSGGGGLSGIDYDGSMATRKSCAVTLLALERSLYPPIPWDGEVDAAWPPKNIDHWEEAPKAICLTSDYEGWYANVFLTPRMIDFARKKGIKFTFRPQGDISFCIPDYLRRYYEQGQGVIEYSNQGFLHEFNLLPFFSPYYHAQIVTDSVDRMKRFAGIQMKGFMPAGGFLTSPDLLNPGRQLGLHYILCPQGKYASIFDKFFDIYSQVKAPATHMSAVSHFSERVGDLAYGTVEEDIKGNIDFVDAMVTQYDQSPYAPYTAWHYAHGFQMPDDDAFSVLEATVDHIKEQYVNKGDMVFATLSDVATYFEEGKPTFRTPVASVEPVPPGPQPAEGGGGCGSCSQLPMDSSRSIAVNYFVEGVFMIGLFWSFFGVHRLPRPLQRRGHMRALFQKRGPYWVFGICGLLALWAAIGCSSDETSFRPVPFTVMTYNIMFDFPDPGFDRWSVRKEFVADIIKAHDPDIIGLQEPFAFQVEDLLQLCPGYQSIALVNPPARLTDTDATILFKEDRFEKISQGSYWLSPTPDVAFSGGFGKGFGNFLPRMVIYAQMRDLYTGLIFYHVDTHFDNTAPSQEKSAPLFLERAEPLAEKWPVIATGDFNSQPDTVAYHILTTGAQEGNGDHFKLQNSFDLAPGYKVVAREGDPTDYDPTTRIDHVFVAGGAFSCTQWTVDMTSYGEARKYPSDHFAVVVNLQVQQAN